MKVSAMTQGVTYHPVAGLVLPKCDIDGFCNCRLLGRQRVPGHSLLEIILLYISLGRSEVGSKAVTFWQLVDATALTHSGQGVLVTG